MDLWANIKRLRDEKGKSQMRVYLDGGADEGGVDPSALSKIENGKTPNPELHTLTRIARGIGVHVAELFVDPDGQPVELPPFREKTVAQKGAKALAS